MLVKVIATILLISAVMAAASAEIETPAKSAPANSPEEKALKEQALLNAPSDASSKKLLQNVRTTTGTKAGLRNVVAYGTFNYGGYAKDYQLIEAAEGRRAIIFKWTYLGRPYTETIVSVPRNRAQMDVPDLWRVITKAVPGKDGTATKERIFLSLQRGAAILHEERFGQTSISENKRINAKQLTHEQLQVISGQHAERSADYFREVPLFKHEFFHREVTGFKFVSMDKLAKREVYVIRRGSTSYYYIDKTNFLLLRWGRMENFGGKNLEVSYMANSFKRWSGSSGPVLLPSKISIVADDRTVGHYSIDRLEIDTDIDQSIFIPPTIHARKNRPHQRH